VGLSDFLLITIEGDGNSIAHELPNQGVPVGPRIDLQTVVSRKIVVTKEVTENTDIL
jgi:hypothetical protein